MLLLLLQLQRKSFRATQSHSAFKRNLTQFSLQGCDSDETWAQVSVGVLTVVPEDVQLSPNQLHLDPVSSAIIVEGVRRRDFTAASATKKVVICGVHFTPEDYIPGDMMECEMGFRHHNRLSAISPSVLLLGDFNYHIDNINCKHASEFLDLLDCLNLTQHVNFPTHNHSHTLDLVCSTGLTIQQLSSINLHISDHLAIILDIHLPTPLPKDKRIISFRNLKSISPQDFSASLSNTLSTFPPPLSDDPSPSN
ncbi:hypothetical protein ABVT39_014403 [Epinephelus coioides]